MFLKNLLPPSGYKGLWSYYFEDSQYIENQMSFIASLLVEVPQHQKMLLKEIMGKVGRDEPISEKYAKLLNFDSDFEDKIKSNATEKTKHWSVSLAYAHLIDRKVSGETQSDFRKTLFNLYVLAGIDQTRQAGSSEGYINYSWMLSNYAGNTEMDKSVVDGLVWDKINLSKESHAVLLQEFKEALFNVNNYSDYKEAVRAIKDLDREEPKPIIAHYLFFKLLVKEFVPELESALLEKEMKTVNTSRSVCKI